jgi:predicted transcriptional regulator of viral defense system
MPRSFGHGRGRLDWPHLADYALRFRSHSLAQRLGYLADLLSLPMDDATHKRLLDATGKSTCYLGQPGRWGRGGEYNATWRVVDNVPRRELLGDIEVR